MRKITATDYWLVMGTAMVKSSRDTRHVRGHIKATDAHFPTVELLLSHRSIEISEQIIYITGTLSHRRGN